MFSWVLKKGIKQGIFWGILIYLVSSLNDVLMKMLGTRLDFIEIAFFRFVFSVLVILIPMLCSNRNLFRSNMIAMHLCKGIIGAVALGLCCFSVNVLPLAENTVILFSESLFLLLLSAIFLKEKISLTSLLATFIGFCGLILIFRPKSENLNTFALIPTIAAFLFAIMDIMIKKMIDKNEHQLTILFYFGLFSTLISGLFVPYVWKMPNKIEFLLILLLGIGSNLIQVCIFMAFKATKAGNIAPLRYTEFLFSLLFGYLFFHQVPSNISLIGALVIIVSTCILGRKTLK